jgi:hypothetical protein
MPTASILLLVIGLLGAFDVFWFHRRQARLNERPECRAEAVVHVARGFVYVAQFVAIPNVAFHGRWVLALLALFAIDVVIGIADVLIEPASRRAQGGLPGGEYLAHLVLSVLVGALLREVAVTAWSWWPEATALRFESAAPTSIRVALAILAVGCLFVTLLDVAELLERASPRPKPIHVSVEIPAPIERVWAITQDPELHPRWDRRFDRIEILGGAIATGTEMLYEKTILGVTILGVGRYQLHRPPSSGARAQSTFAFGSDDRRSLIAHGVGLWRYRARGGRTVFSTSYTYAVRWGIFGRIFDRLVFRPLFKWETERSFRRLAREHFGVARPQVAGAAGRFPAALEHGVRPPHGALEVS